jgi:hypothetical protein
LSIRNDSFRSRLWIRLLRKFRLRLRILFRIRQRWSPPRETCVANSHCIREITTIYKKFFRKWTYAKSVILEQVIHSISMV